MSTSKSIFSAKKVFIYILLIIAIHFFLLVEATFFTHLIKSRISSERPKATFEELYTRKQLDKVSIVKACSLEGGCLDNVALFASGINSYSVDLFVTFMEENPSIGIVCLLSEGGDIDQATKMASIIVDKGLTTCMADYYRFSDNIVIKASYCLSACNQVLLSSRERKQIGSLTTFSGHAAGNTATLSFGFDIMEWRFQHSFNAVNNGFLTALNYADTPDKKRHLAYFDTVKNINHLKEMRTLSLDEMKDYRIFTHLWFRKL
jgi:hypothetical protein